MLCLRERRFRFVRSAGEGSRCRMDFPELASAACCENKIPGCEFSRTAFFFGISGLRVFLLPVSNVAYNNKKAPRMKCFSREVDPFSPEKTQDASPHGNSGLRFFCFFPAAESPRFQFSGLRFFIPSGISACPDPLPPRFRRTAAQELPLPPLPVRTRPQAR